MQLHFNHADHTRVLRDVRQKRLADIVWEHIYYVGFRIFAGGKERYRHALILADNFETFLEGIASEYSAILDQPTVTSAKDISLVFIRNLMTKQSDMAESPDYRNITTEIQKELPQGDGQHYMVFGTLGEDRICLFKLQADEALTAIDMACSASLEQTKKRFVALEVCLAHPASIECYALFDAAFERISALIDGVAIGTHFLQ
jgi:hypothetical protein